MKITYSQLAQHIGHTIECVQHGDMGAAIACSDCKEILVNFNKEDTTVLDALHEGEGWINDDLTIKDVLEILNGGAYIPNGGADAVMAECSDVVLDYCRNRCISPEVDVRSQEDFNQAWLDAAVRHWCGEILPDIEAYMGGPLSVEPSNIDKSTLLMIRHFDEAHFIDIDNLDLHKIYPFEEIYHFAKYHKLSVPEFGDFTPLAEMEIEEFIERKRNDSHHSEGIGEIALPLYDEESMELVANYLLVKHRPEASSLWERSKWRCIYVSERFSTTETAQL